MGSAYSLYARYINYERKGVKSVSVKVTIPDKFANIQELSEFYAIKEKTATNLICEMKKIPEYNVFKYYRLSGRVWFPAFDESLLLREQVKYK